MSQQYAQFDPEEARKLKNERRRLDRQNLTPEQREIMREKQRNYRKRKRENASKDACQFHPEEARKLKNERRRLMRNITPEQREIMREKQRNYRKRKRENASEEEQAKARQQRREYWRRSRNNLSEEEKQKRRERHRIYERSRKHNLAEIHKIKMRERNREHNRILRDKRKHSSEDKIQQIPENSRTGDCVKRRNLHRAGDTERSKCPVCLKYFLTSSLQSHMINHLPRAAQPFQCKLCKRGFSTHNAYRAHHRENHAFELPMTLSTFSCDLCSVTVETRVKYVDHMRQHVAAGDAKIGENEEMLFYQCDAQSCFICFRDKTMFDHHVVTAHPNSIICDTCGKVFAIVENYEKHVTVAHTSDSSGAEELEVTCDYCWQIIKDGDIERHRKQHVLIFSEVRTPGFVCQDCGKGFPSEGKMMSHMQGVHPDKQMDSTTCQVCTQQFRTIQVLHSHYLKVHTYDHPLVCYICAKEFSYLHVLNSHLRGHKGQGRQTKYHDCGYCTKSFSFHVNRNHHQVLAHASIHLANRPFYCPACFRAFQYESLYNDHMRSHEKHRCHICKQYFLGKQGLNSHMPGHMRSWSSGRRKRPDFQLVRKAKEERLREVGTLIHTSVVTSGKEMLNLIVTSRKRDLVALRRRRKKNSIDSQDNEDKLQDSNSMELQDNEDIGSDEDNLQSGREDIDLSEEATTSVAAEEATTSVAAEEATTSAAAEEATTSTAAEEATTSAAAEETVTQNDTTADPRFKCNFCKYASNWKWNLKTHLRIHTTVERTFECSRCQKKFSDPSTLRHHIKIHNQVKEFNAKIITQNDIPMDVQGQGGQDEIPADVIQIFENTKHLMYICDQCPAQFISAWTLCAHLIYHDSEKIGQFHEVGRSGSSAYRRIDLNKMDLRTIREKYLNPNCKLFQCETCKITILSKINFINHMNGHEASEEITGSGISEIQQTQQNQQTNQCKENSNSKITEEVSNILKTKEGCPELTKIIIEVTRSQTQNARRFQNDKERQSPSQGDLSYSSMDRLTSLYLRYQMNSVSSQSSLTAPIAPVSGSSGSAGGHNTTQNEWEDIDDDVPFEYLEDPLEDPLANTAEDTFRQRIADASAPSGLRVVPLTFMARETEGDVQLGKVEVKAEPIQEEFLPEVPIFEMEDSEEPGSIDAVCRRASAFESLLSRELIHKVKGLPFLTVQLQRLSENVIPGLRVSASSFKIKTEPNEYFTTSLPMSPGVDFEDWQEDRNPEVTDRSWKSRPRAAKRAIASGGESDSDSFSSKIRKRRRKEARSGGSTDKDRSASTKKRRTGSTKKETSASTKKRRTGCTKRETSGSTKKETSGSTKKETSGSTEKETSGSTEKETSGSTKKDTSGSTKKETSGSTKKETSGSTKKETSGSTENETSGSTEKETSGSTEKETSGSTKKEKSRSTGRGMSSSSENERPRRTTNGRYHSTKKERSRRSTKGRSDSTNKEGEFSCPRCDETFEQKRSLRDHIRLHPNESDEYPCTECDAVYSISNDLLHHLRESHLQQCPICKKRFPASFGLQAHIQRHTSNTYNCSVCSKSYNFLVSLKVHHRKVHGRIPSEISAARTVSEQKGHFHCHVCSKTFDYKKRFDRHLRVHFKAGELAPNGPTFFTRSCDGNGCSMQFIHKETFRRHLETHPPSGILPSCVSCPKLFAEEETLQSHAQRVHEQNEIDCPYCPNSFTGDAALQEHIESIHKMDLSLSLNGDFICDACGQAFCQQKTLDRHKAMEHGHFIEGGEKNIVPYWRKEMGGKVSNNEKCSCPVCGKTIGVRSRANHLLSEHTYEHGLSCFICLRQFSRYGRLALHLKEHAQGGLVPPDVILPSKPERIHKKRPRKSCRFCGEVFCDQLREFKHYFNYHPTEYLKDNPFYCVHCYRAFPTTADLETHQAKIHDHLKCEECGKQLLSLDSLRAHMQRHSR